MHSYLFLTDMYYPKPNANGLCVEAVGKELSKMGNEVHIVCYKYKGEQTNELVDGIYVHRVRPNFFYILKRFYENNYDNRFGKSVWKAARLLKHIEQGIHILHYPIESFLSISRYGKFCKSIINHYKIDTCFALYKPLTSAASIYYWDAEESINKRVLYIVDSFCDGRDKDQAFLNSRNWKWEKSLYSKYDIIINMECHKKQL